MMLNSNEILAFGLPYFHFLSIQRTSFYLWIWNNRRDNSKVQIFFLMTSVIRSALLLRLYKKYFRKILQWFLTAFFIWGKSHHNDNYFFFECQSLDVFDSFVHFHRIIFVSFKVFYSIFDNVLLFPFFMILWVWVIILFLCFLVISFLFVFDGVEFHVDIVVNQWKRLNVWTSTFFLFMVIT